MELPLILVTNDDGIDSRGLWAAAEAVLPLGDVFVVAPDRQWSGGGRSMPPHVTGRIRPAGRRVGEAWISAYAVDASPALAVQHGVLELAPRRPALVISGVNSGANLGSEVTASGTVGAALEASAFGIPALAISLDMDPAYHLTGDAAADYTAARAFTRQFAETMLSCILPQDVDVLSLNLPADATPATPWRLTRLARERYFIPTPPNRSNGTSRPGYRVMDDISRLSPDSDIWAVKVDRCISVTPLSLDLTARVDFGFLEPWLGGERAEVRLERIGLPLVEIDQAWRLYESVMLTPARPLARMKAHTRRGGGGEGGTRRQGDLSVPPRPL